MSQNLTGLYHFSKKDLHKHMQLIMLSTERVYFQKHK